jgi:hypothetical protein
VGGVTASGSVSRPRGSGPGDHGPAARSSAADGVRAGPVAPAPRASHRPGAALARVPLEGHPGAERVLV